jgi:hypothetical protein
MVTVADVVTLLQGQIATPGVSYYIFGHEVTSASISMLITDLTAYNVEYWPASILTTKAALIDILTRYEVAMEVMGIQVMGQLMISGFSYSTLELSVSKGADFSEKSNRVREALKLRWDKIRRMLQDDVEYDSNLFMGEGTWEGLETFDNDTITIT